MTVISAREYGRARGLSERKVRRLIRERGAPVVQRGRPGPGGATLIDPDEFDRFLSRAAADVGTVRAQIASALLDVIKRTVGDKALTAPQLVGIRERDAAGLLVLAFDRIDRTLRGTGCDSEDRPEAIGHLLTIWQAGDRR